MSTNYPAQIDTSANLPTAIDNFTPIRAVTVNNLRDAILAIEAELGIKPSGIYATVRARLDVLQSSIDSINAISLAGDLGGTTTDPLVIGIYGRPVSNTPPAVGQVLEWNGEAWIPTTLPGGSGVTFSHDLSGSDSAQTVIGIQGVPVNGTAPVLGQTLIYNGAQYSPGTNFGSQTVQTTGQLISGPALMTSATSALFQMNGKLVAEGVSTILPSGSGQGIIYFDNTQNRFLVSENGGSYVPLTETTVELVVITTNYNPLPTDTVISVGTISSGITITLQASPSTGKFLYIKDAKGLAATYNITVQGNGNNIDGASSYVMSNNFESILLIFDGTEWMLM